MPDGSLTARRPNGRILSADALVRRLSWRYLLVLLAVGTLIAADQAIIQPLLMRMDVYAPVINLAGRQRMLSQKLAKSALALHWADEASVQSGRLRELRKALNEWSSAHQALRYGDARLWAPHIQSEELDDAWQQLQPHFDMMQAAARELLDEVPDDASPERTVRQIIEHEPEFLASMEQVVSLLEREAAAALSRLRLLAVAVAATILALIASLNLLVVRPATREILNQVDNLESRVALRTRELDEALASLQRAVDEREKSEMRNRTLAAQLAHADRVESLGGLATGLAHELNQPLGAIANYAEACDATLSAEDEDAPRRLRNYLRQMQQAAMRAGAIVRRIRNFARPGPSAAAPVDMADLASEVVELCRYEAAKTGTDVALRLPEGPAIVLADAIGVQQVLVNLVQNGLQAMASVPPGSRRLEINVAIAGDGVRIDVVDSGRGLVEADPAILFEPFHTTKAEGLGVGLAICRSIVEHHQGTIWARSLPGRGAQFSFVLPLAAAHAPQPVG